jgi:hypothetical protein
MTYRRDSDIIMYYDALFPITSDPNMASRNDIIYAWTDVIATVANKTGMIMQLVSNCAAHSSREVYVKAMTALGLEIDVYGGCGKAMVNCRRYPNECEVAYLKRYRFYIAFENHVCRCVTFKTFS